MGGNLSKDPLIYIGSISSYSLCSCLMCCLFLFLITKVFANTTTESVKSVSPAFTELAKNASNIPFIPV
jgi:hypothetical protein